MMSGQIPDKNYVFNGLLRCNYFPMVKEHLDEIPPIFSTKDLTSDIAEDIAEQIFQIAVRRNGYDQIEYRTTRFNGVIRRMHIPHPFPYAHLCKCISDNWENLNHICNNPASQIKPALHDDDRIVILGEYEKLVAGRVVVMEKEKFPEAVLQVLELSNNARYRANADISSCFPSIYTHSIPWALVGHDKAKSNRSAAEWYNQLDKFQRDVKRGETHGIPIGPATSNIISEIILDKVDKKLMEKGYRFLRFIDDYKCYCETHEQAEQFLLDLEHELGKYLLTINAKKVLIEELPIPHRSGWVIDLVNHLPPDENPSARRVADFLDYAVNLQKQYSEGSVVKYAARSLVKKINKNNVKVFLRYLTMISFHYPVVLPILCEVAKKNTEATRDLDFDCILKQHLKFRRSDAACWTLYIMGICGKTIDDQLADEVISSKDCIPMATFIALDQHKEKVVRFLNDNCDLNSEYDYDKYWILLHELSEETEKFNHYRESSGLKLLSDKKVHFVMPIQEDN